MNLEQRVIQEISYQLGIDTSEIKHESTFSELNIDSLDHVELTMALEDPGQS